MLMKSPARGDLTIPATQKKRPMNPANPSRVRVLLDVKHHEVNVLHGTAVFFWVHEVTCIRDHLWKRLANLMAHLNMPVVHH